MVPVGYEPDLYVNGVDEDPSKWRGTTDDYKAMWKNFVRIFNDEGVDNVVWIMDYSFNIRLDGGAEAAAELWPEDNVVSWLFFNVFQFTKVSFADMKGDCPGGLNKIYGDLMDNMDRVPAWNDIPWGLGAWGSNGDNKWLPMKDRKHCIDEVREQLESGDYPKLKAAVSFNSLGSRIDETLSPELIPNFEALMSSPAFYDE